MDRVDLQTKNFDEKENTVTVTGTFDPEKFMKKICRKVGKFILSYEVNEINVKKEEKGAAKKDKAAKGEKDPAAEEKKKDKNEDKEDDKKKVNDKKKDAAPNVEKDKALDIPEVVKSAPKPAAAAAMETPVSSELYSVPAIGAPANWGYYGNYPYGYHPKACYGIHERPPCPCGCSYGQNHYGQQNQFFSEEESACSVM